MHSYDDLPTYIALDSQAESEDSISINWTNNTISELETNDDFTYIEHIGTGRKMWIPTDYIFKEHHCDDFTDYVLPINAGDTLSVVKQTSRGYIAKKNGITGWYCGRLESKPNESN